MNVGELLGLDGDSLLLAEASRRWQEWRHGDERLLPVERFEDLRAHCRAVLPQQADQCLLALAMLAAPDGGDDVAAAGALAKTLLPGASVLAGRLSRSAARTRPQLLVDNRINELVASQLWIEVRSFAWRRLSKVGGNVLMNTRAAVLRELEDYSQVERRDRTWARTVCLDADILELAAGAAEDHMADDPSRFECLTPGEELEVVLGWAREHEVVSDEDCRLLRCLLEESARTPVRSTTRGRGNLCSDALADLVAPRMGMSPSTVRRRASRTVQALVDAVPSGLCA